MDYANYRFLIVDAIKQSRDSLKQFAYNLGDVRVDITAYVRDALSYCQDVRYDVILLGYDLGEKQKNGQQLLEELRVKNLVKQQAIVIIITAEISQAMVLAALEHKPDEYLTKPFTLKDLKRRLDRSLSKKQAMNKVYRALDNGQHDQAIERCQHVIEQYPQYRNECFGIISRQYFELKQYQKAEEIYQGYKDKPNCQWAAIGLGKIALAQENYQLAIEHFDSIIEKTPRYLKAYDWLAKAYQLKGEKKKAEQTLEQGLVVSPRSVGRLKNYALLCLENENYEKATDAFKQTNELALNSVHHKPENALLFATSLLELFHKLPSQEAKKLANQAYQALHIMAREFNQEELIIRGHLLTASLQVKTKEHTTANNTTRRAEKLLETLHHDLSVNGTIEISKSLISLDRKDTATELLTTLAQNNPEDKKLLEQIDQCAGNKISSTVSQAQESVKVAMAHYQNKRFEQAIDELNKVLSMFPEHNGIKMNLLQVLLVAQEQAQARAQDLIQSKSLISEFEQLSPKHYSLDRFQKLKTKYISLNEVQEQS